MITAGTMILILIIFMAAICVAFYSGFFIAKKTIKPAIEVEKEEKDEIVPFKPDQSFLDKILEFISDGVFNKKHEDPKEVEKVVTSDGIEKNVNDFYN